MSVFSLDSKFMQTMSQLADLMLLNLLYLVTCIPIFTIGAATTALYSVSFRMGTEREAGIFRPYFRSFRQNFKQGTILFLILFLPTVILLINCLLTLTLTSLPHALIYLYVPMLFLLSFIYSYTFPLLSQFNNTTTRTLKNALYLSVGYLPKTLLVVALNLLPFVLLYVRTLFFLQLGFIWVLVYFSAAAYLNAKILRKVFAPYRDKAETEEAE